MATCGRIWTPGVLDQTKATATLAGLTANSPKHAPTLSPTRHVACMYGKDCNTSTRAIGDAAQASPVTRGCMAQQARPP